MNFYLVIRIFNSFQTKFIYNSVIILLYHVSSVTISGKMTVVAFHHSILSLRLAIHHNFKTNDNLIQEKNILSDI